MCINIESDHPRSFVDGGRGEGGGAYHVFRARFRDSGYANATASPGVIVVIIVIVGLAGIIMLTRYSIYVVDREVSLSLSLRWREPCEPACARASELKGLATRGGYHVPGMNMYGRRHECT